MLMTVVVSAIRAELGQGFRVLSLGLTSWSGKARSPSHSRLARAGFHRALVVQGTREAETVVDPWMQKGSRRQKHLGREP